VKKWDPIVKIGHLFQIIKDRVTNYLRLSDVIHEKSDTRNEKEVGPYIIVRFSMRVTCPFGTNGTRER
jgi:hypothetical protein